MFIYDKQKELEKIEACIAEGEYKDSWDSLARHKTPQWFQDAKFGIFIHWGVYSVPAFGNEWYSRNMYIQGSPEFEHHVKTYGEHKKFGYKDFIPMLAKHVAARPHLCRIPFGQRAVIHLKTVMMLRSTARPRTASSTGFLWGTGRSLRAISRMPRSREIFTGRRCRSAIIFRITPRIFRNCRISLPCKRLYLRELSALDIHNCRRRLDDPHLRAD